MSRGEPREAVREFWPDQAPGNFVGGDWRSVDQLYEVDDPSTGLPLSAVPSTCPAEVDAAIEVAAAAQPEWAAATLSERAAVIRGLVEPLRAWGERLTALGLPTPETHCRRRGETSTWRCAISRSGRGGCSRRPVAATCRIATDCRWS